MVSTVFAIIFASIVIYFFSKKLKEISSSSNNDLGLGFLNQNIQSLQQTMNDRLDNASRVIMSVNNELGQMKEIGSNLKNIQDFLKSPKLRGNLGEQGLKELLSGALPSKYYDFQYVFRNGFIVDAIIHLEAGKIPIDSKYPLENFNQMLKASDESEKTIFRRRFKDDFKKHVIAIAKKYINPDEGTTDFAFMYIPSESIFFEVVNNEPDMFEFAANSRIILTSPSTFFYYLRTIMLGLEGRRITEMSREVMKVLKTLKQQSNLLGENLGVLQKHLGNANKTMSVVSDQYIKLSEKILKIDSLEEQQTELLEEKV